MHQLKLYHNLVDESETQVCFLADHVIGVLLAVNKDPPSQFVLIQVTPLVSIVITNEHQSVGFSVEETIVRRTFNVVDD
jgi:hypothetical protein